MIITESVYQEIIKSYPVVPPENGGILGEQNGVICAYVHDPKQQSQDAAIYEPNVEFLNNQIKKWSECNISFVGMIHSHPAGQKTLSSEDLKYAKTIFSSNPMLEKLLFPLIIPKCAIFAYILRTVNDEVTVETDSLFVLEEGGDKSERKKRTSCAL